jgi:hypothetical protein
VSDEPDLPQTPDDPRATGEWEPMPKLALPRAWEIATTTPHKPLIPEDSPYWDAIIPHQRVPFPSIASMEHPGMQSVITAAMEAEHEKARQESMRTREPYPDEELQDRIVSVHNQYCRDDWAMYNGDGPRGMGPNGDGCVCSMAPELEPPGPRLWDKEPEGIVHIAGACMVMFGIFMRQRCDWCGLILLEYDLRRLAFRTDDPNPYPSNWEPGSLVRVDGHMSASIENPMRINGDLQLPPDCCAFDPKTQVK